MWFEDDVEETPSITKSQGKWNGEYYVSFGERPIEIGKMPENGDLSPPEAEHGIAKRLGFFLREIEYG